MGEQGGGSSLSHGASDARWQPFRRLLGMVVPKPFSQPRPSVFEESNDTAEQNLPQFKFGEVSKCGLQQHARYQNDQPVDNSASLRPTRSRSRLNSDAKVIVESHPENMKESETKIDVEEPSEAPLTPTKSKTVHLMNSAGELQADGDISEAESNCSSMSGLQTPLFIRVTRRRQIVIPCQPEIPSKNRQSKRVVPSEGNRCQEEDDLSEAESCSSSISGTRTPSIVRKTRSQKIKTNISPVCEVQSEEVSDAESWCSGFSSEPSVPFKRITRSMRLRLPEESMLQSKRKSDAVLLEEDENEEKMSETIVISDSEQPTKSDLDAEQASSSSSAQINEQPSPSKTERHSESVSSNDLTQPLSSSPKKTGGKCTKKSPKKEVPKERDEDIKGLVTEQVSDTVMNSEEVVCDPTLEKPVKMTENHSPTERNTGTPSRDLIILEQPLKSPRQTTPNKSKSTVESQKIDIETSALSSLDHEGDVEVSKTPKTSSPQKSSIPSQSVEIIVSTDSDGSQEEPIAESSLCPSQAEPPKELTVSLLTSDESEGSENSDIEEINTEELNDGFANASNQHAGMADKSHGEELFVIDKTPGLDSSKAYYLEEAKADGELSEESSELEDNEEVFVDEDEDLLNTNNKIVSFSSSIDPGLNVKELGGLYISFDARRQKTCSHGVVPLKEKKKDELLKKSIITPDFEKKECVPPLRESAYQLKKQRRAEREKTTGDGWFGMKAPEMTDELKNDLKALKMRAAIDPKRFYKKNDREGAPKYFQVGTIVDTPADFYHARIPKKERKKNIVEELLADSEFRRYNKRKYQEIMAERAAMAAGKKNRKKKKFHK